MEFSKYHSGEAKRIIGKKLDLQFTNKRGRHDKAWYYVDGKKAARLVLSRGNKPFYEKLYKNIAREMKLTTDELDDLLACPLTAEKYAELVKERINLE